MSRSTLSVFLAGLLFAPALFAQPSQRPLIIVVPYAAGGGYDRVARLISPKLGDAMRQTVIIENRGGAGGTIGMAAVARANPDGNTLVVGGLGDMAIAPSIYSKLPYDTLKDFQPLTMIARFTLLLAAKNDLPVNSVASLLQLAKTRGTPLLTAISSVGSTGHLSAEMFRAATGVPLVIVPYKGTSPALTDLAAGHVEILFTEPGSAVPFVRSGRIKPLAVTTENRSAIFPEVPTMVQAGVPNLVVTGWWGLFAPTGVSAAFVQRINQQLVAIIAMPDVIQELRNAFAEPGGMTGEAFARFVQDETAKYTKAAKAANIKVD